jgi:hypothetical protein
MHKPARAYSAVALVLILPCLPAHCGEVDKYAECWKSSFTEQLAGPVRPKTIKGAASAFTYSYDGDFRWVGDSTKTPVSVTYLYCFHIRHDDGGAVLLDGSTVQLGRVGTKSLPASGRSTPGYDYVSLRDPDVFTTLYGVFQSDGQPPTSLEIQLDRQDSTTTVITRRKAGKQQAATYMKGDAVRATP